jgi:hypothetical protein
MTSGKGHPKEVEEASLRLMYNFLKKIPVIHFEDEVSTIFYEIFSSFLSYDHACNLEIQLSLALLSGLYPRAHLLSIPLYLFV